MFHLHAFLAKGFYQVAAVGDQRRQIREGGICFWSDGGAHRGSVVRQKHSVNLIGFGQKAFGLGVVANVAWINARTGYPAGLKFFKQSKIVAARGFKDDMRALKLE